MNQATLLYSKICFEQFQDTPVLVYPTRRLFEAMIFNRKYRKLPIVLLQFNEPLDETDGILEMNVLINHSVTNQERTPETVSKVDG